MPATFISRMKCWDDVWRGRPRRRKTGSLCDRDPRRPQTPVQTQIIVDHAPRREALAGPIISARPILPRQFAVFIEPSKDVAQALRTVAFKVQRRVAPQLA